MPSSRVACHTRLSRTCGLLHCQTPAFRDRDRGKPSGSWPTAARPAVARRANAAKAHTDQLAALPSTDLGQLFEALAADVVQPGRLVTAGPTPLGRGLMAQRAIEPGSVLLAVPQAHVLCVTDRPEGPGGNASGRQALAAWQAAHGRLPPLLINHLLSGQSGVLRASQRRLGAASSCEAVAAAHLCPPLLLPGT